MPRTQRDGYGMQLGKRIKELREERGLSVIQLADMVGMSRQGVYHLEAGYWGLPKRDTLIALAETLGTTTVDLLQHAGYVPDSSVFDPDVIRLGRAISKLPKAAQASFLKLAETVSAA